MCTGHPTTWELAWVNSNAKLAHWCRVTSLKQRVVAVAAANRHTAILTDAGAIYSWGSNDQGQLGYGTSDSASNALPRQVEAMKVCGAVSLVRAYVRVCVCVCLCACVAPMAMSMREKMA